MGLEEILASAKAQNNAPQYKFTSRCYLIPVSWLKNVVNTLALLVVNGDYNRAVLQPLLK